MLDGRLWFRLGKQDVVWGKTELFRNQDQINPVDLGRTTLGSLEDTRIPLWLARAVYNFYNVGPLEDVRLELVANLGNFMPNDLGRCGEPYTIFLVCGKSVGLVSHGLIGIALAGEIRPPSVWDDLSGLQSGARVEWRWDRFSFALSDYYGYDYFPTANNFNTYSRAVDPLTGHPLDSQGHTFGPNPDNVTGSAAISEQALLNNAGNRQFFDVFCSATVGVASGLVPLPGLDLSNECALTLFSSQQKVLGLPIASLFGIILANEGRSVAARSSTFSSESSNPGPTRQRSLRSIRFRVRPRAGTQQRPHGAAACPFRLWSLLRNELRMQQGIDLFNTEASVLVQSFPMFEPGGPVATRVVNGHL